MMILQSTPRCGRTPDVLLALEELGLSYKLERVEEGYFTERFGRMGPVLNDGGLVAFEPAAIIRHLARRARGTELWPTDDDEVCRAEQWMDYSISQVRPAAVRVFMAKQAGAGPEQLAAEMQKLIGVLEVVDRAVENREYLLGAFTLADCAFTGLSMMQAQGGFGPLTSLAAYAKRLASRPAAQRLLRPQ